MRHCFILLCLLIASVAHAQTETLTNEDIIKMTKIDLPPSAILSKIKASRTHFDVGVDALVALKGQSVNGDVISEMIAANSSEQKDIASVKDMNDPKTMRKQGIYYYNKSDPSKLFVPIDPTVVSNSKSGGLGVRLAQSASYGLAKDKQISELSGAHSRRQIPHTSPRFYFYLDPAVNLSPNEFALVLLTEKEYHREMVIGTANAYGGVNRREREAEGGLPI